MIGRDLRRFRGQFELVRGDGWQRSSGQAGSALSQDAEGIAASPGRPGLATIGCWGVLRVAFHRVAGGGCLRVADVEFAALGPSTTACSLPTTLWSAVIDLVIQGQSVAEAGYGDLEMPWEQPVAPSRSAAHPAVSAQRRSVARGCPVPAKVIQQVSRAVSRRYRMRPPPVTSICPCSQVCPRWVPWVRRGRAPMRSSSAGGPTRTSSPTRRSEKLDHHINPGSGVSSHLAEARSAVLFRLARPAPPHRAASRSRG